MQKQRCEFTACRKEDGLQEQGEIHESFFNLAAYLRQPYRDQWFRPFDQKMIQFLCINHISLATMSMRLLSCGRLTCVLCAFRWIKVAKMKTWCTPNVPQDFGHTLDFHPVGTSAIKPCYAYVSIRLDAMRTLLLVKPVKGTFGHVWD